MNNFMKKNQPYKNLNYDFSDYATGIVSSVADIMSRQPLSINEFKTFFGD